MLPLLGRRECEWQQNQKHPAKHAGQRLLYVTCPPPPSHAKSSWMPCPNTKGNSPVLALFSAGDEFGFRASPRTSPTVVGHVTAELSRGALQLGSLRAPEVWRSCVINSPCERRRHGYPARREKGCFFSG